MRQPRARAAAAPPTPTRASSDRIARFLPTRFLPTGRSLLAGCAIAAAAAGCYALARQTSMFAVATIEVSGAPPAVRHSVRRAAAPAVGTNLLALDGAALLRRIVALPTVVSARYDRSFPHTLRIRVVPERPVAVLRRGRESWLVSARARVVARLRRGADPEYPRVWVPTATPVELGGTLAGAEGGTEARALELASRFPARVATVSLAHDALTFRLRSGLELRLGRPVDMRLKLAVARRALRALPPGSTYLDVSVPGRPVAGLNPQLSSGG